MSKIRADLVGVVMAAGRTFAAGQDVPDGVGVHESLLEGPQEPQKSSKPDEGTRAAEGATEDPGADKKDAEKDDPEDFSDILSDDEKPAPVKPSPRGGRKPAASKKA